MFRQSTFSNCLTSPPPQTNAHTERIAMVDTRQTENYSLLTSSYMIESNARRPYFTRANFKAQPVFQAPTSRIILILVRILVASCCHISWSFFERLVHQYSQYYSSQLVLCVADAQSQLSNKIKEKQNPLTSRSKFTSLFLYVERWIVIFTMSNCKTTTRKVNVQK